MLQSNVDRKDAKAAWDRLKPVYFSRWTWERAVQGEPHKYSFHYPTYQDKKVILT